MDKAMAITGIVASSMIIAIAPASPRCGELLILGIASLASAIITYKASS